jgi:hypothetical protein
MQSVEAGVRYAGLWFGHANHERLAREFNLPHTDWAHQVGMRATLQENAMVASLGGRLFDPELHYGNFPDSWVKDADGNGPFLHWEGVCVNESPRFSYGRKKLEVMKRFVEQYGFDDAYLDLYYFGPQCDYGHTYEQYPFFPFLVGLNEHLVDWAGYLHQRGMSLTLNAPHHASAWVRFGDIITADAGDLTLFPLWFKTLIGHRLNGNLGSSSWQPDPSKTVRFQGEVGRFRFHYELALFNGAFPRGHFYNSEARQWYTADANVRQAQRDLWSRNLSLAWNVAQSRLVAGEPFWHYFYLHRDGTVFLCARNGTTRREERRVPTDFRRLGWQKEGRYTVVEWNLDEGATLRSGSLPGIELSQGLPVHLEPEETKVWIITPHRPVVLTDFFAYFTLRNLYTIFSTAQLVAADERGGRAILALDAVPDRETVTRLRVGSPHRPRVTVSDAQSSEVRWVDPVTVEVRVKHRAQRGKIGIEEG